MRTICFKEGFDLYNGTGAGVGLLARWNNQSNSGGSTAMVAGRFGGQAARLQDGTGANQVFLCAFDQPTGNGFAMGFAFRHDSLQNLGGSAPFLYTFDTAGGVQLNFSVTSLGALLIQRNGTTIVSTPNSTVPLATWVYIELFGKIASAANGGYVYCFVNGVQAAEFAGNTLATANANLNSIQIRSADGSGGGNSSYFDDMYVADGAARLGERRIETLRPNGDTTAKAFVPNAGTTNYTQVDDAQATTTDYVTGSNLGDLDLYELSDLSNAPLEIDAVTLIAFAAKTDATTRAIKLVVDSGGTQSRSGDKALAAGTIMFRHKLEANPLGGADWDAAAIAALRVGPEVSI